jgi:hypothetical protein
LNYYYHGDAAQLNIVDIVDICNSLDAQP